jgi:hypothetical protein
MYCFSFSPQPLNTVTCYHPSHSDGWRDTNWFTTRVPDQTLPRFHFTQGCRDLCRPRPPDRTRDSAQFSSLWVGPRPMRNSSLTGLGRVVCQSPRIGSEYTEANQKQFPPTGLLARNNCRARHTTHQCLVHVGIGREMENREIEDCRMNVEM